MKKPRIAARLFEFGSPGQMNRVTGSSPFRLRNGEAEEMNLNTGLVIREHNLTGWNRGPYEEALPLILNVNVYGVSDSVRLTVYGPNSFMTNGTSLIGITKLAPLEKSSSSH